MYICTYGPYLTLQFVRRFEKEMKIMSLSQFVVYLKSLTIIRSEVCTAAHACIYYAYSTAWYRCLNANMYIVPFTFVILLWHILHYQLVKEYLEGLRNRRSRVGNPLGKDFSQLLQTFFDK